MLTYLSDHRANYSRSFFMIVFSSVCGTGRTFNSSFLITVLSPPSRSLITSPSRSRSWSRLIMVVSSALTTLAIGAVTSAAAMHVKISLFIATSSLEGLLEKLGDGQNVPVEQSPWCAPHLRQLIFLLFQMLGL